MRLARAGLFSLRCYLMSFIYALCDPDTNEVRYVGKSDSPQKRYREHLRTDSKCTYCARWIQSLMRQGKRPHIQILEEVTDNWVEREQWWIAEMRRRGARLTNLTDGGEGIVGYKYPLEIVERIAAKHRGRTMSEEHRRIISRTHKGQKRPTEWRKKMSDRRKGIVFTAEHRANISRGKMGHPAHNKGENSTREQKRAISRAQRVLTDAQVNEIRQLLRAGDLKQKEIAKLYHVSTTTISMIKQGHIYCSEGD